MTPKGKIINDPVYGFLHFPEKEVMKIIDHPWFQRLRNIKQMGTAYLVYPGAVHTRLHHSLGACHLMGKALQVLKEKDIAISNDEYIGARIAALLHDVGHGPFSHALEHVLIKDVSHEKISRWVMQHIEIENTEVLQKAKAIFDGKTEKKFLHSLVSGQLDVDRMDYLNRDSFYTGVSEGIISHDRILQMLTVNNGELMVEEKGVHSVEKFIIARRLMYWQVYLHKAVLGSERLLVNIFRRAKELAGQGVALEVAMPIKHFLYRNITEADFMEDIRHLRYFMELDDTDVYAAIKLWQSHNDKVLSVLCKMLVRRNLYKLVLSAGNIDNIYEEKLEAFRKVHPYFSNEACTYFVFKGKTATHTYNMDDEHINIAMKDKSIRNISKVDDALVTQTLARPVHKNYICFTLPGYNVFE